MLCNNIYTLWSCIAKTEKYWKYDIQYYCSNIGQHCENDPYRKNIVQNVCRTKVTGYTRCGSHKITIIFKRNMKFIGNPLSNAKFCSKINIFRCNPFCVRSSALPKLHEVKWCHLPSVSKRRAARKETKGIMVTEYSFMFVS